MPRNSSGTYTLPELPFVAGTVIESNPVNSNFSDIATALTQSLPTNGVAPMTGPLFLSNGTVTAPSLAFSNSVGTGLYRIADNHIGYAVNGSPALDIDTNGILNLDSGMTFGNSEIATATVLDWYQEGTFVPSVNFDGGSVGLTYSTRGGQYTRIGNVVFFTLFILLTNKGSSTGAAYIGDLPYEAVGSPTLLGLDIGGWTPPADFDQLYARVYPNVAFGMMDLVYAANGNLGGVPSSAIANNSYFSVSGAYRVA